VGERRLVLLFREVTIQYVTPPPTMHPAAVLNTILLV
jgi:hypothetical protein